MSAEKHKSKQIKILGNIFLIIAVVCSIVVVTLLIIDDKNDLESTTSQVQNTTITLEKFEQIEMEMTYQEVVNIIGEEGTLSTESLYGGQSMEIYCWYDSTGVSNATISFMNGRVTGKSQIGLK